MVDELDVTPPKARRRGRRPAEFTSPEEKATPAAEAPKKRRARLSKAERRERLANEIVGAHRFAAMMTGLPELAMMEPQSALAIAEAAYQAAEEWGIDLDDGGKYLSVLQLVCAVGFAYYPMLTALRERALRERAARAKPAQAPPPPPEFIPPEGDPVGFRKAA